MIYVSILEDSFRAVEESKNINGTQYYYVRVFPLNMEDGTIRAVEVELDHEPTAEDIAAIEAEAVAREQARKISEIKVYDKSANVNGFLYNGNEYWFDKQTRVGLVNSIAIEKIAGKANTIIYCGDTPVELSIEDAEDFLKDLELYAIACFRQTEDHIAAVRALTSPYEVKAYDHTASYPAKIELDALV